MTDQPTKEGLGECPFCGSKPKTSGERIKVTHKSDCYFSATPPGGGKGTPVVYVLKSSLFDKTSQWNRREPSQRDELAIIKSFCEEVNRRAEGNMLKTGKLEGSHYAAMTQILKERQTLATKEKNEQPL